MRNRLPPPNFSEFNERVRVLLSLHNGSITSTVRSHLHNLEVGGGQSSWHRLERGAVACDIVLDDMSQGFREMFCVQARQLGMDAVDEVDHIHLEPSDQ